MAKAPTQKTAPRPDWPESIEKRVLRCDLAPREVADYAKEQSEIIQEVDRLEDQKKASASHYKALIEEKQARGRRIAAYITDGWQEKDVLCEWRYECAGYDAHAGQFIYHPEKKALVRLDTEEVVEVRDITNEEHQMALPMESPED